jgi:hypothetical protein
MKKISCFNSFIWTTIRIIGFVLANTMLSYAQYQERPVNIQSPNAAGFEQIAEVPVNMFTGQPSINIPICQVSTGSYNAPINLNYNATGFRPDAHSGWVGMNWNLSAEGVITRKINDLADESSNFTGDAGFYYTYQTINDINWNTPAFINGLLTNNKASMEDTEPDEFNFSMLGFSGSFFLSETGVWTSRSDSNFKILFNDTFLYPPFPPPNGTNSFYTQNGNKFQKTFSGFTILAADGTKFVFGGVTDAIEFSIPMFEQKNSTWMANSWYLTKITWPNGKEINYTYQRIQDKENGMFICSMFESVGVVIRALTKKNDNDPLSTPCAANTFDLPTTGIYNGELISPVYLLSIETNNEKVSFEISPTTEMQYDVSVFNNVYQACCQGIRGDFFMPYLERHWSEAFEYGDDINNFLIPINRMKWYKLDKIVVFNKVKSSNHAQYEFKYNNLGNERLILKSLKEFGQSNVSKPPYVFTYNYSASTDFPSYLSRKVDHWGFYSNRMAVPSTGNYFLDREPGETYPTTGMLSSIQYPTGGFLFLTFENHYFRKSIAENRSAALLSYGTNKLGGGARIKRIKISDGINTSKDIIRDFFYVAGYSPSVNVNTLASSGILGGLARYYWNDYDLKTTDPGLTYFQEIFSSSSVLPASNNSYGNHIGYSEVVEKLSHGGYTINKYSNFDTGSTYMDELGEGNLQPRRTPYEEYSSKEYRRGKLLFKNLYNSAGAPIKSTAYEYTSILPNTWVRGVKAKYGSIFCSVSAVLVPLGVSYKNYLTYDLLSKETSTEYVSGLPTISSVQEFVYDDYKNILEQKNYGSDGKTYKTTFKYPYHFAAISVDYSGCVQYGGPCREACIESSNNRDELEDCYYSCANRYNNCRQQAEELASSSNIYLAMKIKNQISQYIEKRQYVIENGQTFLLGATINPF